MKRKVNIGVKLFGAATVVAALLSGASPMMVHAGGYECTCEEKCTEEHIDGDCPLCSINYKLCYGAEPEAEPEVEPDSKEEEPEEYYGPLTPDGNMTLVDDYGSPEGGKQFITVVTKSGHYFYIIIDRDDNGSEKVHFLNLVDEADLLALMDEDEAESYLKGHEEAEQQEAVEKPVEKPEEPEEEEKKETPKKKSNTGVLGIVVLVMLGGVGGYVYYTKTKGSKKPKNEYVDPDADYDESTDAYLESLPEDPENDVDFEMETENETNEEIKEEE